MELALNTVEFKNASTSVFDWFFRDRRTGKVVLVQRPNAALIVWFAVWVLKFVLPQSGAWGTVLAVGYGVALVVWSGSEIVNGVNPWRRLLGGAVLAIWFMT